MSVESPDEQKRVTIVGCGLIGGSVGLGLRKLGWNVSVVDSNVEVERLAISLGVADEVGFDYDCDLVVVGTPVSSIGEIVSASLRDTNAVVIDLGSTKADICSVIDHPRFIGGHPMAGSELDGINGASVDLFEGAIWILTPGQNVDGSAFEFVHKTITTLGADCVTLEPEVHDRVVAQVSHIPHLTAATLMNLAASESVGHEMLLRLAAGGFRDMTRISAGRSAIWPDICFSNKAAIVEGIDALVESLSSVKNWIVFSDRSSLLAHLETAREARLNLPRGFGSTSTISEVVIPVQNKPGEIAAVANLAAELAVNIIDVAISHSAQGLGGAMILLVESENADSLVASLKELNYLPRVKALDVVDSK